MDSVLPNVSLHPMLSYVVHLCGFRTQLFLSEQTAEISWSRQFSHLINTCHVVTMHIGLDSVDGKHRYIAWTLTSENLQFNEENNMCTIKSYNHIKMSSVIGKM